MIHQLAEVTLPPDGVVSLVAVDATGFTCDYASDWYCERTGRTRKAFMKLSVAVDTERLTLLGFAMSRTPIHEVRHAPAVLRQAYRHVHAPVYVMDKAYDAESIHRFIVEDLQAEALIPGRKFAGTVVTGRYRSRAHDQFDPSRYHQRAAVETTFSIMKRKWGGHLTARKRWNQRKEMKLKLIVYALEILGILTFLRWIRAFQQSRKSTQKSTLKRLFFLFRGVQVLEVTWQEGDKENDSRAERRHEADSDPSRAGMPKNIIDWKITAECEKLKRILGYWRRRLVVSLLLRPKKNRLLSTWN